MTSIRVVCRSFPYQLSDKTPATGTETAESHPVKDKAERHKVKLQDIRSLNQKLTIYLRINADLNKTDLEIKNPISVKGYT